MRLNSPGSLMLEYAIYSGIATILVVVMVHCFVLLQRNARIAASSQHTILQTTTILTVLTRDLWQAPPDQALWYRVQNNEAIWAGGEKDIGWVVKGTDLFRVLGTYDRVQGRWHSAHRSLVARNVSRFVVKLNKDLCSGGHQVVSVSSSVTLQIHNSERIVAWETALRRRNYA